MNYICHRRFQGKDLNGKSVNLPYGTKLHAIDNYIIDERSRPICFRNSECCFKHFAQDSDGQGLKRGGLTFLIAYKQRKKNGFRFTEEEREMLERKWKKYLRDLDVILFNREFFTAPINDLEEIARDLGMKVD